VRLLVWLSQGLSSVDGDDPALEALKESLGLASQLADPKLVARLTGVRSIINFHFFRLREAVDDGIECEQMGGADAPPWQRALQLRVMYPALVYLGRSKEAASVANDLEPFARRIGQSFPITLIRTIGAWAEFGRAPDLARLEASLQQALQSDPTVRFAFWVVISEAQQSLVDFYRGNWAEALSHAQAS
jgi:hypothetical protein